MTVGSERLQALMQLPYAITITPCSSGFMAYCQGLSLFARGDTAAEAIAGLEAEKWRFFERYIAAGEPVALPPTSPDISPLPNVRGSELRRAALLGFCGAMGVIVAMTVFLVITAFSAAQGGRFIASRFSQYLVMRVETNALSLQSLPPEEQEARRAKFRALLQTVRPYVEEIRLTLGEVDCKPTSR